MNRDGHPRGRPARTALGAVSRRLADIWLNQPGARARLSLTRYTTGAAIMRHVAHMPRGEVLQEQLAILEAAGQPRGSRRWERTTYEALRVLTLASAAAWTLGNDHPAIRITTNLSFLALQRRLVAVHKDLYSYTSHLNVFLLLLSVVDSRGTTATSSRQDEVASAALAAMQIYYATMYLQSGLSKVMVTGPKWMDGRTLRGAMAELGTPFGKSMSRRDLRLLAAASAASVAFELGFLPAMLLGWPYRHLLGLSSVAFHGSVKATMNISFWHLSCFAIPLFVLSPDVERRVRQTARLVRRHLTPC
ncbi:hypothetical protein E1295_07215 [Nonomuraea mesophila]|uniref:HTTM domain-containing protein n=1 Tax=Nonomuraea mesophila TaxID=2530382 RepID=A0A4R5FUI7_9ACTN|nr:hypothetical protein [Nonomuraea mesophila]TDE57744.1 hypothetical protein E1295_07215 [Nonomuraea mesophila]